MRRKFSRNHSLSVVVSFIAILILSVAFVALAQMPGAGPEFSQHVVSPAQLASDAQKPQVLFAKAVTYSSGPGEGPSAASVAIADLNGDGKLDLAVVNSGLGTVAVLLGNGNGTFQTAVPYSTGGGDPNAVAIGDVNGDGKPDIVVANCVDGCQSDSEGSVSVLLGNGDGTFQAPVSYSVWAADSVAIADLNGDGYPDLVVAEYCYAEGCNTNEVSVLLNNGDGTFQPAVSYGVPGYLAFSVAIADVNNDGKPDLVVANGCLDYSCVSCCGSVGVLLGNGDGTFQPAVTYDAGSGGSWEANSVAVADVNGDGYPDLVVADEGPWPFTHGAVGVLLGNGDGTFQPAVTYSSGAGGAYSVAVADVNGDGKPDVVVADDDGKVGVLLGNGNGTFQKAVLYSSGGGPPEWWSTSSIAIGDVNGDGRPDLVVVDACFSDCSNGGVGVLLNKTTRAITTTTVTSSPNPSQVGQTVTFTATVSSTRPIPDGQIVAFSTGKTKLGTATTTNGVASLNTSFSKAETYTIKASYAGGGFFGASSGTMKQVVEQ